MDLRLIEHQLKSLEDELKAMEDDFQSWKMKICDISTLLLLAHIFDSIICQQELYPNEEHEFYPWSK